MSDNPSHYEVPGVQHDATPEQIIHGYKAKGIDENPQDSPQDEVEALVAPHDAPSQSEIQPVDADDEVEAPVAPPDVPPQTEMQSDVSRMAAREESEQWVDAIENGDNFKLKELLGKDRSCLWKYEKKGRTALTIAAEVDDGELATLILGDLLEAQLEKKTPFFFRLLNPASDFDSLTDYVEKSDRPNDLSDHSLWVFIQETQFWRGKELEWYSISIELRDWATLRIMLDTREFLMDFEENRKGHRLSLLHIAAMHGCFPLVEKLLNKLTSEVEMGSFGQHLALELITAVDPQTHLTALQIADEIIGNRSISEFIKLKLRFLESSENKISDFFANRSEGLFEAYPHTQWYKELKMYIEQGHGSWRGSRVDSTMLQQSLQQNSRLLLEAFHGLSALLLAIIFRDYELVEVVRALFGLQRKIVWGDSYYPQELGWEQMCMARGLDGVEFNMKTFHQTELNLLPYYNISTRKIAETDSIGWDLTDIVFKDVITTLLPEQSRTFSAMNEYINQEWKENREEWQTGFEADADFNFEAEPRKSLLRVHHACKDPLRFQGFLESVSEHESFNDFSTRMHDAQGRTLHHVLLDHHSADKLPGWAFTEIFSPEVSKFCIKHAQDSRGRRLMDVLIGKNCLQRNIILGPYSYFDMKFEHSATSEDLPFFGIYYVACALQQTVIAGQPLWAEVLQAHLTKLKTLKLLLFATAASTNQTMLQALSRIKPRVDLMIQDKEKRTLLHYAADPTSLQFETLLDMASDFERTMIYNCFSTVQDYCEFLKKPLSKIDMGINSKDQNPRADDGKEQAIQSNVRSRACILMLLQAGLDLSQPDNDRKVPSLGPTSDATYQTWWYDTVVKDATDNKNSFNQAGNALSVVGTLVAATSYIGPLQPPMSYTEGLVRHSEKLVEVFMVTNTLAFFLAMASVMFAVVPSLPMPRESVLSELRRARHMVSVSLCLLLVAIAAIIVSFSAASVVVSQYEHSFPRSNALIGPLLAGWSICLIAVASFFIRILRLAFYENAVVQVIYQFSFREFCMRTSKSYSSFLMRTSKSYSSFLMRTSKSYSSFLVQEYKYFWDVLFHRIVDSTSLPNPNSFLDNMIDILVVVYAVILIFSSLLLFPIYHVFHITVLIPCRKLIVHSARFRGRHKGGDRNSDDDLASSRSSSSLSTYRSLRLERPSSKNTDPFSLHDSH